MLSIATTLVINSYPKILIICYLIQEKKSKYWCIEKESRGQFIGKFTKIHHMHQEVYDTVLESVGEELGLVYS
jgi:hypothetical protein